MKKIILAIFIFSVSQESSALENDVMMKGHQDNIEIHKKINRFNDLKQKLKISKNLSDKDFEIEAEKVAKELQDVLASKIMSAMYEGINPNPMFGGGNSEKMFQSLLNDERAKYLDLGLVKPIKEQIISIKQGRERYKKNATK